MLANGPSVPAQLDCGNALPLRRSLTVDRISGNALPHSSCAGTLGGQMHVTMKVGHLFLRSRHACVPFLRLSGSTACCEQNLDPQNSNAHNVTFIDGRCCKSHRLSTSLRSLVSLPKDCDLHLRLWLEMDTPRVLMLLWKLSADDS